jgi:hypothetical protein
MTTDKETSLVISYMTLRKIIGILGMALPFVLSLGEWAIFGKGLQGSMSAYYHTGMRDVFVGILFAIGFFLFSYKGPDRKDNIAGNLACLFAVGVALFRTTPEGKDAVDVAGIVHLACAGLFFLTLTYFSLFLFTKTNPDVKPTRRKLQRNIVYRVCGGIMAASILLMMLYSFLPKGVTAPLKPLSPIYWLEALAIIAFGVSWFVKGEAILKDETEAVK